MPSVDRTFGSLSAVLNAGPDNYLTFEFIGKGTKRISSIVGQYTKIDGTDTSAIISGRLVVFQEKFENVKDKSGNPFGVNDNANIVFDANINNYEPFQFHFTGKFLESAIDGNLTVVLFYPVKTDASPVKARLNVLGDSQSSQLQNVKINSGI